MGKTLESPRHERVRQGKGRTYSGFLSLKEEVTQGEDVFSFASESRPSLRHMGSLKTERCSCEDFYQNRLVRGIPEYECYHLEALRMIVVWSEMQLSHLYELAVKYRGKAMQNVVRAAYDLKTARWERHGRTLNVVFADHLFSPVWDQDTDPTPAAPALAEAA